MGIAKWRNVLPGLGSRAFWGLTLQTDSALNFPVVFNLFRWDVRWNLIPKLWGYYGKSEGISCCHLLETAKSESGFLSGIARTLLPLESRRWAAGDEGAQLWMSQRVHRSHISGQPSDFHKVQSPPLLPSFYLLKLSSKFLQKWCICSSLFLQESLLFLGKVHQFFSVRFFTCQETEPASLLTFWVPLGSPTCSGGAWGLNRVIHKSREHSPGHNKY